MNSRQLILSGFVLTVTAILACFCEGIQFWVVSIFGGLVVFGIMNTPAPKK